MALVFMDSFAHYSIDQMPRKWLASTGNALVTGNNGGKALQMSPTGQAFLSVAPTNFCIIGFRLKIDQGNNSAELYSAMAVGMSRSLRGYISLFLLPDGRLAIFAGEGGLFLADTAGFTLHSGIYYYVELKFSTSSGTDSGSGKKNVSVSGATLRVDGSTKISNASGSVIVDETDWITPQGDFDVHHFTSVAATSAGTIIQDLYIFDGNGDSNVDFAGDSRMGCIFPRADVDTDWIPLTGSQHFPMVNEHISDDDGTYVKSKNPGDQDEYQFDEIDTIGEIAAAQYLILARKDDEGLRSLKATMDTSPVGEEQFINDSYLYYRYPFDIDPPESAASFNTRTFGMIIQS